MSFLVGFREVVRKIRNFPIDLPCWGLSRRIFAAAVAGSAYVSSCVDLRHAGGTKSGTPSADFLGLGLCFWMRRKRHKKSAGEAGVSARKLGSQDRGWSRRHRQRTGAQERD
ncbi:hypothetical protein GCM10009095_15550 [Sphingomonas molluscorum]|nr:hypothetical protein GCM10017606_34400 [Microbacterium terregens]